MLGVLKVATRRFMGAPSQAFRHEICLPFLLETQNSDGGWGNQLGLGSTIEPTCSALLALASASNSGEVANSVGRGSDWLLAAQLPDGSWPACLGQQEGCWVTSLACLTFHTQGLARSAVARGVRWLCDAWPGEGKLWWRIRNRVFGESFVVKQNHSLRGWSWTPGTSSWTEPTSYALILLRILPEDLLLGGAVRRQRLGEAMLYDRMCSGGGWNCGNPMVYGVAGQPQVGPTVWALLALQDYPDRPENQKSLDWLECAYEHIRGPGSLALAHLCLETYGRATPPLEPTLQRFFLNNQFFHSVPAMAWVLAALNPTRNFLEPVRRGVLER